MPLAVARELLDAKRSVDVKGSSAGSRLSTRVAIVTAAALQRRPCRVCRQRRLARSVCLANSGDVGRRKVSIPIAPSVTRGTRKSVDFADKLGTMTPVTTFVSTRCGHQGTQPLTPGAPISSTVLRAENQPKPEAGTPGTSHLSW